MVIDAIIRHWVKVVRGGQEVTGQGLGESIQTLLDILYTNDGIIASPESARLQGLFYVLTGLFNQVVLRTNEGKTVSMACPLCRTPHAWSTDSYTRRVTGRGVSYRERLCQRVHCFECVFNLADKSLAAKLAAATRSWVHRGHPTTPPRGGGGRNLG